MDFEPSENFAKKNSNGAPQTSLLHPLDAKLLDGANTTNHSEKCARLLEVPLSHLSPMKNQPRQMFDEAALQELAASIRAHGILQPIIVTEKLGQNGHYTIVAGERRFRASKLLGLKTVPVVVRHIAEESQLELALIENIQREELNPMEEAETLQRLITEHNYTHENLAKRLGKDRATISNMLRLLSLPSEIQLDLKEKRISSGHGRAICAVEGKKFQLRARDIIVSKKLSVRKSEELVKSLRKSKETHKILRDALAPDLRHLCEELKSCLQLKVRISGGNDQGKIEIEYFSADDLERLSKTLLGDLFEMERGKAR